jgi:hypothetical protein
VTITVDINVVFDVLLPPLAAHLGRGDGRSLFLVFDFRVAKELSRFRVQKNR